MRTDMTEVHLDGISHSYGRASVVSDVNLSVKKGEFLTLLGPSGSGKTTLLRIVAGLIRPAAGRVMINDVDITDVPPRRRNIGLVFQNYALFPHLTVFENVAFPLHVRRVGESQTKQRVSEVLDLVRLSSLTSRYPSQLSGGQQQRVAVARAIVFRPDVLLMDEPLGALDRRLRQDLEIELRRLQRDVGITTIYVTHDQEEAFSLSHRIGVMFDGVIRQLDSPEEVYRKPVDPTVARFVGDLNYFEGICGDDGVLETTDGLRIRMVTGQAFPGAARSYACGIRPEHVKIGRDVTTDNAFRGRIRVSEFRGTYYRAQVDLASGAQLLAEMDPEADTVKEGEEVFAGWDSRDTLAWPMKTATPQNDPPYQSKIGERMSER
jgi:putative spermidine/putrescine transport system ATP-binding protein